jgi:hypothetical protein
MAEKMDEVLCDKNYTFFTKGNYNLNIIAIRSDSGDASSFDDSINVLYKKSGKWVWDTYPATTEPGPSLLRSPLKSVKDIGTAILVPGQYRSTYQIGTHGGKRKYTALVQRGGPVAVWRDNNRDSKPDYLGPEIEGWYGINIHRHWGSDEREYTQGVSAGCQVFRSSKDFYEFMETCNRSADRFENSFTFTLLQESDMK